MGKFMTEYYLVDTNVLLDNQEIFNDYKDREFVIIEDVLREIENLERRKNDKTLQFKIRKLKRGILDAENITFAEETKGLVDSVRDKYMADYDDFADNNIIAYALYLKDNNDTPIIVTNDILLKIKALRFGVDVVGLEYDPNDNYNGIYYFEYDEDNQEHVDLLDSMYMRPTTNDMDLKVNQYLHVYNVKTDKHTFGKYNGTFVETIKWDKIRGYFFDKFAPRNGNQKLAFDLMQDDDIKVKAIIGKQGAGKDVIQIAHAVKGIEEGKFDKIVWVRNNVEVEGTNEIGFLPNGLEDKLKPYVMPLADHIGGEHVLDEWLLNGKVEVIHLGHLRGRDIKNAIIYCTEMQNSTESHLKLLLGRVSEGSELWINGDTKQSDVNSSANALSNLYKLAGNPLFGMVELDKIERSEVAELSDLLD